MTRKVLLAGATGVVLNLALAGGVYAATCTVVVHRGQFDPSGAAFTNRFDERVAIDDLGNVLFIARAKGFRQALYLYPSVGLGQIVARVGDPEPGGSSFKSFGLRSFGRLSMNSLGLAAFRAKIALPGEGVYVHDGVAIEKAVRTTDPSPSGGTFLSFASVSAIRDSGEIYFAGIVDGGPSGIFRYNAVTNAPLDTLLDTTDVDDGGRPFCEFQQVGLSDGLAAFVATVGIPDCTTPVQGVFRLNGPGSSTTIARVGDASPVAGSNFDVFLEAPETGTGTITFAAHATGVPFTGDLIVSWDGISMTKVVGVGDAAPDIGGFVSRRGGQHRQILAGDVFARLDVKETVVNGRGIFSFGAVDQAVVVKTDVPPAPFGPGAQFRKFGLPAIDDGGTWLGLQVKVKDTLHPRSKTGVIRCTP